MTEDGFPDFVLAGTTKAASTWIYECFEDHPEIATHDSDTLHYFDMHAHKGLDWYRDQFNPTPDQMIGEASPTYMYSEGAIERMAAELPDVELFFCLRNPVDRAFSHWWHGYSDGLWSYEFEEGVKEYQPYRMWVEPGLYAHYLDIFNEHFDNEQMHVWLFDDLVANNGVFISEVFDAVGVDADYIPTPVGSTSNEARTEAPNFYQEAVKWVRKNAPDQFNSAVRPLWQQVRWLAEDRSKYEEGMAPSVHAELERIYADDVRRLSDRIDRNLDHWFDYSDL